MCRKNGQGYVFCFETSQLFQRMGEISIPPVCGESRQSTDVTSTGDGGRTAEFSNATSWGSRVSLGTEGVNSISGTARPPC